MDNARIYSSDKVINLIKKNNKYLFTFSSIFSRLKKNTFGRITTRYYFTYETVKFNKR